MLLTALHVPPSRFASKSIGTPQLSLPFLQKAMMDENVQYLVLAAYWWFSKPVSSSPAICSTRLLLTFLGDAAATGFPDCSCVSEFS